MPSTDAVAGPVLTDVTPDEGSGGTAVTLTGTGFGARTDSSAVRFSVPGGDPVPAAIRSWTDTVVVATVPAVADLGSGGPTEVRVAVETGTSGPVDFLLDENASPVLTTVTPALGLPGSQVRLTGSGFGRLAPGSAVLFADVPSIVDSWEPGAVVVRAPVPEAVGGAGVKQVRVHTPWGDSGTVDYELGELPVVASVEPPSAAPGALIEINGHAFGSRPPGIVEIVGSYPGDSVIPPAEVRLQMQVRQWNDTRIAAVVPDFGQLRTTGVKQIVVTSRWGAGTGHQFVVTDRGSITAWTRVEPHARADNLDAGLETGLQAQVYDALWLLGRQWQLRELDGDDAGSPVAVTVTGETAPIARWRPHGGVAADVPDGTVPLETLVEHEAVLPPRDGRSRLTDRRLAAEAGLQWLRILARHLSRPDRIDDYRRRYQQWRPLPAPTDAERATLDATTLRLLDLLAGRVPDGAQLYAELQRALPQNGGDIPDRPPVDHVDRQGFRAAAVQWFAWWDATFSQGTTGGQTWDPAVMRYGFDVSAETTPGEVVLAAPDYDGNRLDWYSLGLSGGDSLRANPRTPATPSPSPFTRTVMPSAVTFPGAPSTRWFEMEDAAVDFGAVAAGPTDLMRLLFVEFATVFGSDWFTVPLEALPVGALSRLASVTVTDTFGRQTSVGPLADSVGGLRVFDLGDRPDLLLVADTLPSTFESAPLEEVLLLRDELANLAWGVERIVTGAAGRPVNRGEVWQARVAATPVPAPPIGGPPLAYRLMTTVPDYWIPFVPAVDRDAAGTVQARWLARAALPDPDTGQPIRPLGDLLAHDRDTLRIFDEVVARDGVRLRRHWQYGRAPDGSTHLWRARRRGTGRGEGSSGLRYDLVDPR
jgi:hypothetical protein